ncbi:MAG: DUF2589 domain-containing protein [Candidatus Nitrosocaldaceae archaeon]
MSANILVELSALPIESLIGKPLEAAIRARVYAAMTTVRFIQVGLLDDRGNVKNIAYKYRKKTVDPNTHAQTETDTQFDAPLLSILPIPYIRIKDMTVHFNFTKDNVN